ncbi:hypothetical protein K7432_016791, partial [Basidiobolus ranarum]
MNSVKLNYPELSNTQRNLDPNYNSTTHSNTTPLTTEEEHYASLIKKLMGSLEILTTFFHVANLERDEKCALESSYFRYLDSHDIMKLMTSILVSKDARNPFFRDQALPYLFNFCLTIWQTKQGLVYLSSELERSDTGSDHMFTTWVDSLIHNDNTLRSESGPSDTLFGWLNSKVLYGCPGILDYRRWWVNEYSHRFADRTGSSTGLRHTDSPISTLTCIPGSKIQFTLEEFVTILLYQVYTVRLVTQLVSYSDSKGKRPVLIEKEDYLQTNQLIKLMHDMCLLNVGKQAIASVISFLGALPILISYSSSNPHAKRLVTTIFSYYHLLDIKLTHADFDRLKITYQQDSRDDPIYYTVLKYQKHNDLGVLIDILANTEKKDFLKDSVINKVTFCIRILLKHSYIGTDTLSILSSQLNIIGATQEDPILVYLLRIIESAIEHLSEVNKISSLYSDTSGDEGLILRKMSTMSSSESLGSSERLVNPAFQYSNSNLESSNVKRIKMKNKWLELTLLTLELIFNIIYHTGDGLIVSVTLTEPEEKAPEDMNLDITRDDHLLNECFKQVLKLLYTLDQLDIHNLRPKHHATPIDREHIDSYTLLLLRSNHEVIYRFFDMVNIVIPDQVSEAYYEGAGKEQYRFKCKIPTDLIGNKVVQYLLDGLHDAPQHFLSGIKLLTNLLPLPYVNAAYPYGKSLGGHEDPPFVKRGDRDLTYSGNCLRMYWAKQLLPLKDDIEECLRTLISTSCKEMHISLRLLITQMVDLDIGDLGIARGIFKLLIDQLYEELEAFSHVLHTMEYKTTHGDFNQQSHPSALGSDDSCIWQQSSFEEQFIASRISRLLCLLLSLVKMASGHFYLLDIFEGNIKDGSNQNLGMFFDIAEL